MNRFNRPTITAMNRAMEYILLLLFLLTLTSAASAAGDSPMMLPSSACTDQLVIFSSCLPFIGAYPNNRTDFPPPECCSDISDAFTNGSAICVCYLILEPEILGFPLNSTKLLSLTSLCPRNDQNSMDNVSLQTLCSDSAALPPLHSITGSINPKPHNATVAGIPPPPPPPHQELSSDASTDDPADEELPNEASPSIPSSSTTSPSIPSSSTTRRIYWLRWTVLSFLL